MSVVKLRIEAKRYKGLSKSGLSHTFLSCSNGGVWFSIPTKAITKWEDSMFKVNDKAELPVITVTFDRWVLNYGSNGTNVSIALDRIAKRKPIEDVRM